MLNGPQSSLDCSWMRFDTTYGLGIGGAYTTDSCGYFHCRTCDVLLIHKARYCDEHQKRRNRHGLKVVC